MQTRKSPTVGCLIFLLAFLTTPAQPQEAQIAWTRHYAHESETGYDVPRGMLVDSTGNVYIVAYVSNLVYGQSLLLVKLDPAGDELWRAEYTSGPIEETAPVVLRFDHEQNIYILGHATHQGSMLGLFLIKYDKHGNQLQLIQYRDVYPTSAVSLAIAADRSVYITGNLNPPDSDSDILILKYDPDGQLVWKNQYDDSAGEDDNAVSIAIGPDQSIYALGRSETTDDQVMQIITRRLSPSGELLWERVRNTIGSGPTGFTVDQNGSIYVFARNDRFSEILKYDATGELLWEQQTHPRLSRLSYANAMTVDSRHNVYVVGRDRTTLSMNFFTIKYDNQGTEKWRAIFDAGEDDEARSVVVDSAGNVYVSGDITAGGATDFMTVKYDSAGNEIWTQSYNDQKEGGFLSVDQVRTVGLAPDGVVAYGSTSIKQFGPSTQDLLVVKHNFEDGEETWNRRLNGPGRTDVSIVHLGVDGANNIYLAGVRPNAEVIDTGNHIIVKYDPNGSIQWEKQYFAGEEPFNSLPVMAVDREGNVYIGGRRKAMLLGIWRTLDILKIDTDGQQQWHFPLNFEQNMPPNITIYSLAVGPNGTVCFSTNDPAYALVSLNDAGLLNWINSLTSQQSIIQIVFDSENNVYAIGYHIARQVFINKYEANGNFQWSREIDDASIADWDAEFATWHGENLYVTYTGHSTGKGFTAKYSGAGEQVWLTEYSAPSGGARTIALKVDQAANVLVTGWQASSGGDREYLTLKYNAQGEQEWARSYAGPEGFDNMPVAIGVDSAGNATVTGQSTRGLLDDFETVQYSSDGDIRWSHRYASPADRGDQALALALDSKGDVIVMGYVYNTRFTASSVYSDPVATTLIKYVTPPVSSVSGPDGSNITDWILNHNYPNPFNPTTRITYAVPEQTHVRLNIFNLAGERIKTLVDGLTTAGRHSVAWDGKDNAGKPVASGIYFYKLEADDFREVKRMLLLR